MASVKTIEMAQEETIEALKEKIEGVFGVKKHEQVLLCNSRNISTNSKRPMEMGIEDGATLVLKRVNKIAGSKTGNGLEEMLKNPFMKNMLKNPQTLKSLQSMFPDIEEGNETMKMLFNNGGIEEELEKMTQDGDYLNSQLRNVDVAMAKLENMPGGMNMMSSMLKDIEDPLKKIMAQPRYSPGQAINKKTTSSLPGNVKENPLIKFKAQNLELVNLGFSNATDNIEALTQSGGDIGNAVELLLMKYWN
ncbi:hypothetical protein NUSPORA_02615 [Nucleospora cyclopteri]